jgi:hypothetical protein
MALDPSIPLQAKAPDINPLATLLQIGQYKYLQQNSNRLQMDTDANQAVGRAIQRNTGADGRVNLLMAQRDLASDPAAAYNLQAATGTNLAQQGQQIGNGTAQIQQQGAQLGLNSQFRAHVVQQLGTLLNKKDLSYNDAVLATAQAGQMFGLPADVVQKSVASMPTDPAALKPYLQSQLAALQAPGAQLGTMSPNPVQTTDGATNTFRDVNPVTNPGIVGTSFNQRLSPAQATGRMPTVGPDGTPGSVPFSSTVPLSLLPPDMQGGGATPGRYPAGPANGGFIPSGQAPGVAEAATAAGQGAGQDLLVDQKANAESGKRINMLQNAADALSKATTGTGADKLNAVKGVVAMLGGPAEGVKNYDEANKYLTQYAQQKAASFGHATDAQLSAALTGNGNTHISNLAAQDVVKVNMALERMDQARMQAWQSAGLPPAQYSQWKSQFGAAMDPRVFVADQMPAPKVGAMVKAMNAKERETFRQQYNWAVQNGYINGPQ